MRLRGAYPYGDDEMEIKRSFWQHLIEQAWQERSVIWLMGVRRMGKTKLCQSLPNVEYFDCEIPEVRQALSNITLFLESQHGKRIVLDEIHCLDNPSQLLKIAADYHPSVKIIATGSSTLGASAKFSDTLTGRKREVWLSSLLLEETEKLENFTIERRFLFGGLPAYFTAQKLPEADFREWNDAYWAKDIQDLFTVGKRQSFLKFAALLLAQSGGQFEASKFTVSCEVSRPTINNYLAILEETFVVHVIRPFSTYRQTEIVSAPKVYGFDTGFVCYAKMWSTLRKEDNGILWEHCVLNEIQAYLQIRSINYWRDKRGHEIDFVLRSGRDTITAIECKFSSLSISGDRAALAAIGKNFAAFRDLYPHGENYVVCYDVTIPFQRKHDDLILSFVHPRDLIKNLKNKE